MSYVDKQTDNGCMRLRLANGSGNLLTLEVIRELAESLSEAEESAKAVMLCGGDRFFPNGLDLPWALSQPVDRMHAMFLAIGDLVLRMLSCPVPLTAAVKGHAIGAGKTLMAACDYRYAATGRVLVGVPEILLGVPNPFFADQLLRFLVGDGIASDLIYSGKLVPAETLVTSGLVNQVFPKEAVEDEAWKKTQELALLPPLAFAESKSMRTAELCGRIRGGLPRRMDALMTAWTSDAARQRLHAAAERLKQ